MQAQFGGQCLFLGVPPMGLMIVFGYFDAHGVLIGAVLLKNNASLDKNEKSSTCFFLKLLPIKELRTF
jgi:hypothetical protein